jgi:primosomal protein N' (replication factor Y) (superfamily II helicase)
MLGQKPMSQQRPSLVSVWLPVPKRQSFTYKIPEDWQSPPRPGQLVWVPFGRRKLAGMVDSLDAQIPSHVKELRPLLDIFPEEFTIGPTLFKLLRWAVEHYLAPPGEVLRSFFPNTIFKGKMDKGEGARHRDHVQFFSDVESHHLSENQNKAVKLMTTHLGTFHPTLLQGVTGSGKTEVYLRLCEQVLSRGEGVLVMVPEIALTPQTVGRFVSRFGERVASYHSAMTEVQRHHTWWAVKEGRKKIVIGTRSAVCLPVQKLGMIVVDEEHDSSYKQEERFRYQGRDLAVVRAKLEEVPIILGSATPSMESLENVHRKKYHFLGLPDRATIGTLPKIRLIDLKMHPPHPETFLSEPLSECLKKCIERGEQALLFLNRRGFAPFILCQDCGEVAKCPNCEISLTYHRRPLALKCHYCDFYIPPWEKCLKCAGLNLEAIGMGTEKIEEQLQRQFPKMRLRRLDRDVAQSRNKTEEILSQFGKGEIDVLIGTQLVTKGHDFKRLTLVGILLADVTLNLPDFRAAEKMFQVITQVAGRAGRHELPGEVYLQTFRPEHYAITSALSQDPEKFFVHERGFREELGYPPFSRLVLLRLTGTQTSKVETACHSLAEDLRILFRQFSEVEILGPAKATLEKLRGKYRWQVILRTPKYEKMRRVLGEKLPQLEAALPSGVQLIIDVDPVGVF